LRDRKSEFERMTDFVIIDSVASKVDWMILVDQNDPWDFVSLSQYEREIPVNRLWISI
jgi:hypothetical protein